MYIHISYNIAVKFGASTGLSFFNTGQFSSLRSVTVAISFERRHFYYTCTVINNLLIVQSSGIMILQYLGRYNNGIRLFKLHKPKSYLTSFTTFRPNITIGYITVCVYVCTYIMNDAKVIARKHNSTVILLLKNKPFEGLEIE